MNANIVNINDGKVLTDPRYGSVTALDVPGSVSLKKIDLAIASVFPNAASPAHYHAKTEEIYFITEGTGEMTIDGVTTPIKPGDSIRVPTYTVHSIRAGSDGVKFVVLTSPPYTDADDHEVDTPTVERPVTSNGRIAVVAGTHRRGSVSGKVARQIVSMYHEIGVEVDLIDLTELPESTFGASSYEARYDASTPLAKMFVGASALHVVTPEYNGAYPGSLKHALDAIPYRESFDGKGICLTGIAAGDWGGLRAVDQLAAVFQYRNAHVFGKRVFVRNIDEVQFDDNGRLTEPEIVTRLCAQVVGFANFVRRLSD